MRESFLDYGIEVSGSGQQKVRCPECTPSRKRENQGKKDLSINTDTGQWYCQHCEWHGGLKDEQRLSTPVVQIKREAQIYDRPQFVQTVLPDTAISYFAARGISKQTLEDLKIGFDKGKSSIMFPYFKNGELINIKYRSKDKKFQQCKNAEKCVYLYDNIQNDELVFVEGEADAVAVYEAGYKSVVSLPNGAKEFKFWENVEARLKEVERIIIWTDNDSDGYSARQELAKRVGYERAYYVETTKDCKDANDVLLKHGKDKVLALIADAKEFPIDGIVFAKDVDLISYWKHGAKEGWSTGIPSLDPYWKFAPEVGELVVGTGYPGSGKSDFALDILVRQAKANRKVGIFSPEEFPLPRLMKKCMEKFYGLNAKELCEDQVEACHQWLHDNFFFQYLEDSTPTVDDICNSIKALAVKKGIRFFLCDPWNELDHSVRGGLSETEWINAALGQIRRVARQYCVTVIVVAHPTKPSREDEGKAPSSWSVAGSAAFRNKPDVTYSVHRPKYGHLDEDGEVDINVTKIKDKDMGGLGYVQLGYDYASGTYHSPVTRFVHD